MIMDEEYTTYHVIIGHNLSVNEDLRPRIY